jgi:hypothetical protein
MYFHDTTQRYIPQSCHLYTNICGDILLQNAHYVAGDSQTEYQKEGVLAGKEARYRMGVIRCGPVKNLWGEGDILIQLGPVRKLSKKYCLAYLVSPKLT